MMLFLYYLKRINYRSERNVRGARQCEIFCVRFMKTFAWVKPTLLLKTLTAPWYWERSRAKEKKKKKNFLLNQRSPHQLWQTSIQDFKIVLYCTLLTLVLLAIEISSLLWWDWIYKRNYSMVIGSSYFNWLIYENVSKKDEYA